MATPCEPKSLYGKGEKWIARNIDEREGGFETLHTGFETLHNAEQLHRLSTVENRPLLPGNQGALNKVGGGARQRQRSARSARCRGLESRFAGAVVYWACW